MRVLPVLLCGALWFSTVASAQNASPEVLPAAQPTVVARPVAVRVVNSAFPPAALPPLTEAPKPMISRADLAPYFSTGKAAEGKAAFVAGRFTKARELLAQAPSSPPVSFLRALSAFRLNDFSAASTEFETLAASYPAMKARCLVHAGWSFEGLRDWESAARVFEQVDAASRVYPDARMGLARAKRNLKDFDAAFEALAPFIDKPAPPWGRDVGAEALQALAELHAVKGAKKPERDAWLSLWARHPLTGPGRRAEGHVGELEKLPTDAIVTRAETLIDAHRNDRGVALLEPLLTTLKLPDALACRANFAAGKAYRKLRAHPKSAAVLGPVIKKCKDADLRAKALYTMGFSQTIVAPGAASDTYATLARDYPEHSFADDALFLAADQALHLGDAQKASDWLVELVDAYPTGEFAADGLFKLFWIAHQAQQWDEARAYLEEIELRFRGAADSYEVERARYWKGRVLEEQKALDEAITAYASVAAEHPTTYYGLICRERVEALNAERGAALWKTIAPNMERTDPFPMPTAELTRDPQFLTAVELLRMGLGELVPTELSAIDRSTLSDEALRVMVFVVSMAGEQRIAHGYARIWLRRDLSAPITPANRTLWEIAYPLAFRDLVTKHSADADSLDPDLVQALMREESALDPKALSWAGALGLLQLMPPTAAEVAAQLKLPHPTTGMLLEPDLNIRLGSKYLSGLLTRAKGVKQFALSGYNAGEGATGRWRRAIDDSDLAAWVEQIPVQETRGYVKRVLRSYNTYRLLYAPTDPPRTIAPLGKPTPRKSAHGG